MSHYNQNEIRHLSNVDEDSMPPLTVSPSTDRSNEESDPTSGTSDAWTWFHTACKDLAKAQNDLDKLQPYSLTKSISSAGRFTSKAAMETQKRVDSALKTAQDRSRLWLGKTKSDLVVGLEAGLSFSLKEEEPCREQLLSLVYNASGWFISDEFQ
ncbi:uncharacterized protein IL334_004408 [Kwoniella shivajii]|uniref:Uncharacterized protein n=1 Tax=Kwoniella shivajii TaxID=564305 RepID=A0ABZ1D491_9TREE|nr:hypothetical protein IL334_004408 [Kwoniella shivajii]